MPRPDSLWRTLAAIKEFAFGSNEIPPLFHPTSRRSLTPNWTVTAELICLTPFGTLATQPSYDVLADTEPEAVNLAVAEIRKSYPGYAVETVSAEPKVRH
jgi:hypothetical protein